MPKIHNLEDPLPWDIAIPCNLMAAIAIGQGFDPEKFESCLETAGWELSTAFDTRYDKTLYVWIPPGLETDSDSNLPVLAVREMQDGRWSNVPAMLSFITALKPPDNDFEADFPRSDYQPAWWTKLKVSINKFCNA